jgi:hypothetical protein
VGTTLAECTVVVSAPPGGSFRQTIGRQSFKRFPVFMNISCVPSIRDFGFITILYGFHFKAEHWQTTEDSWLRIA